MESVQGCQRAGKGGCVGRCEGDLEATRARQRPIGPAAHCGTGQVVCQMALGSACSAPLPRRAAGSAALGRVGCAGGPVRGRPRGLELCSDGAGPFWAAPAAAGPGTPARRAALPGRTLARWAHLSARARARVWYSFRRGVGLREGDGVREACPCGCGRSLTVRVRRGVGASTLGFDVRRAADVRRAVQRVRDVEAMQLSGACALHAPGTNLLSLPLTRLSRRRGGRIGFRLRVGTVWPEASGANSKNFTRCPRSEVRGESAKRTRLMYGSARLV